MLNEIKEFLKKQKVEMTDYDGIIVNAWYSPVVYNGKVFMDAKGRFGDGTTIHTSNVLSKKFVSNDIIEIETLNSKYLVIEHEANVFGRIYGC